MPWAATDVLDDAREATQSLLLPFELGRWLRLAVVAFFVGGFSSVGGGGGNAGNVPAGRAPLPGEASLPELSRIVALVLLVVAVLLVLGLLFGAVGAVMEFVLVEVLRTRDVRLRGPFREYLGPGLRLFAFRVAVFLVPVLVVGVPALALFLLGFGLAGAFVLVAALVLALPFVLVAAVVDRLTTDFVVPAMLAEGHGVLAGWRRLWPAFRGDWREFLLYVVVRFVLSIVAGIAVGLVLLVALAVVAVPFLFVGGAVAVATGTGGTAFVAAVAVLAVGFVLAAVVVTAFVQVPVVTYFRYYALYVLGTVVPSLDLVGVDTGGATPPGGSTDEDVADGDDGAGGPTGPAGDGPDR